LHAGEEGRLVGDSGKMNPTIFKLAGRIASESDNGPFIVGRENEASFDESLKTIAHAKNQAFAIAKFAKGVSEGVGELIGEDFASSDIIAVSEPTGDTKDLIALKEGGSFTKAVDVNKVNTAPSEREGESSFVVTVATGSPKDKDTNDGHSQETQEKKKEKGVIFLDRRINPGIIAFVELFGEIRQGEG
jgi:hypothetical protein